MAAIEFIGFTETEIQSFKIKLEPKLLNLGFEHHVVWIEGNKKRVIDINNNPIQLIRIYTRSKLRGHQVESLFSKNVLVRVIAIGISAINNKVYEFSGPIS